MLNNRVYNSSNSTSRHRKKSMIEGKTLSLALYFSITRTPTPLQTNNLLFWMPVLFTWLFKKVYNQLKLYKSPQLIHTNLSHSRKIDSVFFGKWQFLERINSELFNRNSRFFMNDKTCSWSLQLTTLKFSVDFNYVPMMTFLSQNSRRV